MCDCHPSSPLPFSIIKPQKLRQQSYSTVNFSSVNRSGRLKLTSIKASKNTGEVGFKEKGQEEEEKNFELESSRIQKDKETKVGSLGFDILELKDGEKDGKEEQDLVAVEKERNKIRNGRRGKQVIRRSSILAKQVISIQSALSLGFVSQIWVDTKSWVVLVVEVRPNLLSGESERFLLEDVSQVGDVVLVEDENVMDTELKMIGLETLVRVTVHWCAHISVCHMHVCFHNLMNCNRKMFLVSTIFYHFVPFSDFWFE
uniref:Uncharacterized protein n=1 Tax=Populus trichocarpa TaxID=3694 RepID=A9PH11_POPTR|nr:unknown [Populus trichocarpa]